MGEVRKTPVHLWIVGVVSLLWNAMGAFDYLATQMRIEFYMSAFTPEQLEYFHGFPAWGIGAWAIAVWGSVVGSLLLLARSRHAFPVFAVSFAGMVVTTIYSFVLTNGYEVMGGAGTLFSAVIFAIAVALVVYSRAMASNGVLR